MRYIEVLEDNLKIKAKYHFMPMQPGDVPETEADTQRLETDIGYRPMTDIGDGCSAFCKVVSPLLSGLICGIGSKIRIELCE